MEGSKSPFFALGCSFHCSPIMLLEEDIPDGHVVRPVLVRPDPVQGCPFGFERGTEPTLKSCFLAFDDIRQLLGSTDGQQTCDEE